MKTTLQNNIIFVDKPKVKLIPLLLSGASLFFIILGAASLLWLQKPLREASQDIRRDASVDQGQVIVNSALTSSTTYTAGQPAMIELKYNTQGVQITGIQVLIDVIGPVDTPTITLPADTNLQAAFQEVEQTADGYLISMIVIPRTIGQSFSSTTATTFATITAPLTGPGTVTITFDDENSIATVANTNPPQDQFRRVLPASYTITSLIEATATPTATPSETPATTPSTTPSTSPSVAPSVSPTPPSNVNDDLYMRATGNVIEFFTPDDARIPVAIQNVLAYNRYRVRIQYTVQSTLKSDQVNLTPVITSIVVNNQSDSYKESTIAYGLIRSARDGGGTGVETTFTALPANTILLTTDANRTITENDEANNALRLTFSAKTSTGTGGTTTAKQCNESCGSSADCAVNLRCHEGQCRRANYVTSTTCSEPPDGGLNRTCNQYCADTRECKAGFTCSGNRCRRPDNPDSISCAALSAAGRQTTVQSCNKSCGSSKDCAVNLRCYGGVCRLASNPSSLTCSSTTSGSVSGVYGNKGDVLKDPEDPDSPASGSARASASPKSSAGGPLFGTSSPLMASFSPRPTTSPTPKPTVTPSPSADFTIFGRTNLPVALIAVAIGVGLLLLAIVAFIFGKKGGQEKGPHKLAVKEANPQQAKYENELQSKITSLQDQQKMTASSSAVGVTPPPSTLKVTPVTAPNASQITAPTAFSPALTPAMKVDQPVVTPTAPPQDQSSSMMNRLKDKGLMEKLPNTPSSTDQPPR